MKIKAFAAFILIIFYSLGQAVSLSCAEVSMGTQIMNSHGESMELEFNLYDPGSETIVDYEKYGKFEGIGTDKYKYTILDRKGLAAAVGEGVYPNNSVYKDPAYRMVVTKGKLTGSQWDYVNVENQQVAFYKWATSNDTPAVQQFYTAMALEKLGQYRQAVKAYYAIAIHFPRQVGWTIWHTPLYMAKIALDRVDFITREHPELGMELVDARIGITNGFNASTNDDVFVVNPGKITPLDSGKSKPAKIDLSSLPILKTLGQGDVQLVQFNNRHWQLRVKGKPFMVKAVAYSPTPVGKSPHENYNLDSWANSDIDQSGKIDGPYEAWVDKNKNNKKDPNEKVEGDFSIMKKMGVNAIRLYHHSLNKDLLRRMHEEYGIYVIMGDLLGMYGVGSGADWFKGTDYSDPAQKEKMKESVRQLVLEYKDEPYILMWMLGNESNYGEAGDPSKDKVGFGSQAKTQPDSHYAFVNEVAAMIKSIDTKHLVGFSNGDLVTIDILARHSDNIDIFGTNSYRGIHGFGRSFWQDIQEHLDKPTLLTEYGCPAYYAGKSADYGEEKQAEYHKGNWEDILYNSAGGQGLGNAIGGVAFEFVDEWWKAGPPPKLSPSVQETVADFQADFPDGQMHEEWLGLTSQGDGSRSPYMRQTRKVYDYYKKVWNE